LRRRLLAGDDPQQVIAEELPRWSRGGDRELPGLVRRRAAEVALFNAGRYG
jgi:GH24 family phage-related lysozyme (muramidase)